jgi:glycosyltransferase involved in cell wall biosynthesis
MKILHIDTGRELRGGQHQLQLLVAGLAAAGHEQTLLAREPARQFCASHGPVVGRVSGYEPTLLNLWKAARKADLIHAHSGHAHSLAALVSAGKPLIVSRRVAFPIRQNPLSRRNYARADHYIAISEHVRRQLIAGGVAGSKITVVYDGVVIARDTDASNDVAAVPAPERHVLAPQINDPLKGAAVLRSACEQAGVELRFSENLLEDLPRAAAFVYLSENEGLGSAILLAMARKVPVVASRVGGIPELVEHEVSGLLVENRAADVAAALRRMLADRALARRCADAAYQRVSERFRDDIMVRQTEQIYRAVLERRPPL